MLWCSRGLLFLPSAADTHRFALPALFAVWLLQITMANCKFCGFRRVVTVLEQCKVVMKDCLVDLTIKGAYGGEGKLMAMPVVSILVQRQSKMGPCANL
jgi:hypothetical protein